MQAVSDIADLEVAAGWNHWQQEVIEVIRAEYEDLFASVGKEDLDWDAWKRLYEEGHSPHGAVGDAFGVFDRT